MTGSEYIAEFLARVGCHHIFALTGGACAFMLDAVDRHDKLKLVCFQHEQAAAMAADAVWRVSRRVGVTMATSGPGATNLLTGIACSYFDSIPSLHITGQVNQRESVLIHGARIRQVGFQETNIVQMARPIVKYSVMVRNTNELMDELIKAYRIAISGRMGPVLIDVPMDIQQSDMDPIFPEFATEPSQSDDVITHAQDVLISTLRQSKRPIVVWGGGVGMAGASRSLLDWINRSKIPFVSSWAGLSSFNNNSQKFLGPIGVYGNRGANFALQNSDALIVFGSRLDNRQRSSNPEEFAKSATKLVFDIDREELKKYSRDYLTIQLDLALLPKVLSGVDIVCDNAEWDLYTDKMKSTYYRSICSSTAKKLGTLSPYDFIRKLNKLIDKNAIVVADTGAALCWLYQAFEVRSHTLFTAGGNSPMGYSISAAIAAKLEMSERQVIAYAGDGGFHINIQELQTLRYLNLDIIIVVMNNGCYGIIKQFQDSYLAGRYTASEDGYSIPDFGKIAHAYGLKYVRLDKLDNLHPDHLSCGPVILDVILSPETLIEPKLEMGRPINDQYPYLSTEEYLEGNKYVNYDRSNGDECISDVQI